MTRGHLSTEPPDVPLARADTDAPAASEAEQESARLGIPAPGSVPSSPLASDEGQESARPDTAGAPKVLERASQRALEYRGGRREALEALHREVEPLLHLALNRYRRAGSLPLALSFDDLVQESWIMLAELARRWDPQQGSFGAYTRVAFAWKLARHVKKHSSARRSQTLVVTSIGHDRATELQDARVGVNGADWAGALACMEMLETLPLLERQALVLHLVHGRTLNDVAHRLGRSRSTIQRLLNRARRQAEIWQRDEIPAPAPVSHGAPIERLVTTLHKLARPDGAIPGRARICAASGLSQISYGRLMLQLARAGCIVERTPRTPGRLAHPTPRATLGRLAAFSNAAPPIELAEPAIARGAD